MGDYAKKLLQVFNFPTDNKSSNVHVDIDYDQTKLSLCLETFLFCTGHVSQSAELP